MDESLLESMRQALEQNPENVPLRLSLAKAYFDGFDYESAEREYMTGLKYAPHDVSLKTGLAEAYYARGKFSAALVICEELAGKNQATAQTCLLHAKVLLNRDEEEAAAGMYRKAKEMNPDLGDKYLDELVEKTEEPGEKPEPALLLADGDPNARYLPYREKPKINFSDVGGMDGVKEQIRLKIIHPLEHPGIYSAYGKKVGGGILMYGPPGCGKTHIARAAAGEANANFINVAISDVLDMYIGQSEKNLRDVFENARENSPSILFFDEVDALGASRRDMRQAASRQVINQFLSELDGVDCSNEGVLVLAATNAPWHLDGAFRRPGRFDRVIFVPPPDKAARAAILKILLKGKPAAEVDAETLGKKLKDFSGADLKALVDVSIEDKLADAIKTGKPEPLTTRGMLKAAGKIKPTTRAWFTTAKNHALYANDDGHYDDILDYLRLR